MTASASFQISVNGGAYGVAGAAVDVAPGSTVACKLVSTSGVDPASIAWTNFGTHASTQAQLVPVLSGSPTGQIATFTLPATTSGQGYGIECKVNGGALVTLINATTCRCGVYCLDPIGARPFFMSEFVERNATHGVVEDLNGRQWSGAGTNTTTDGSTLQLLTVPVADGFAGVLEVSLWGIQDGGDYVYRVGRHAVRRDGGAATYVNVLLGNASGDNWDATAAGGIPNPSHDCTGATYRLRVTGLVGHTIQWLGRARWLVYGKYK